MQVGDSRVSWSQGGGDRERVSGGAEGGRQVLGQSSVPGVRQVWPGGAQRDQGRGADVHVHADERRRLRAAVRRARRSRYNNICARH